MRITARHLIKRAASTATLGKSPLPPPGLPFRTQVDQPVSISLPDLPPSQAATLHLRVTNGVNLDFDSLVAYDVGPRGVLDLEGAAPLPAAGDRTAYSKLLDSMGLFRALTSRGGGRDQRFWTKDVARPLSCTLSVHRGVVDSLGGAEGAEPLRRYHFERSYLAPGVEREEIAEGRVRGTLFRPAGEAGRRPCVLTMHGGHLQRRVVEDIAAAMASRLGAPTMALGYFGVEGLPRDLFAQPLDVSYFEEAIDLACGRTGCGQVGLWGISKGAEIALLLATLLTDKVQAVTAVNSPARLMFLPCQYKDQFFPGYPSMEGSAAEIFQVMERGGDVIGVKGWDRFLVCRDEHVLPVDKAPAAILFVAGEDDRLVSSAGHADVAAALMEEGGKANFKVAKYPGMGHFVDLPFAPRTRFASHMIAPRDKLVDYGGEDMELHSQGQEQSWIETINFFRENLLAKHSKT